MDKLPPSIDQLEQENWIKIQPHLDDHLMYLTQIYNLAFRIPRYFKERKIKEISDSQEALIIILMRITDFLRSIMSLLARGYPEQACTLASSIFELTHTANALSLDQEKCTKWLSSKSIKDKMPKSIGFNTWHDLVKFNCSSEGYDYKNELNVYTQLCWAKHSLPKMSRLIYNKEQGWISPRVGPHGDEMSINHAWFAAETSGRLTEWVMALLVNAIQSTTMQSYIEELNGLNDFRTRLKRKAIERFGQKSPFEFEE